MQVKSLKYSFTIMLFLSVQLDREVCITESADFHEIACEQAHRPWVTQPQERFGERRDPVENARTSFAGSLLLRRQRVWLKGEPARRLFKKLQFEPDFLDVKKHICIECLQIKVSYFPTSIEKCPLSFIRSSQEIEDVCMQVTLLINIEKDIIQSAT